MKSDLLKIFLCSFSIFFYTSSTAQETKSDLEILGDSIVKKGQTFFFSNNIDSALFYSHKGAEIFKEANVWTRYIGALNDLSYFYYHEKEVTKFREMVLKAYEESVLYLSTNDPYYIAAFSNLQAHYYSLGDYQRATEICKEVVNLNLKNNVAKYNIINGYSNLGNAYRFSGDYKNAINYSKKALEIQLDTLPTAPITSDLYRDIAITFQANNQIDSALYYFQKAEKLLIPVQKSNLFFRIKTNNYLNIAELWNEKKDFQKANQYLQKATVSVPNDFYAIKIEEVRGKILLSKGKALQSVQALKKAQEIAYKSNKRNSPPFKARRALELAKAYETANDPEKALSVYQGALQTLSPGFESDRFMNNPEVTQLLDKPDALQILNNKARLLYQGYIKEQDQQYLESAYTTYLSTTDLIRDFRQGILTDESKKTLSEKNLEIYEGAITAALDLYEKTGDSKYKASAFSLAESNKALLLLESINDRSAKSFAGIPDSLLAQEKDLKLNLAYLQKVSLENKSNDKATSAIEKDIFALQEQLDAFNNMLEKTYPRYFELKYRNTPSSVATIQQSLKGTNKVFLEYFVGENHIYLFILNQHDIHIQRIENAALVQKNVETLRSIINHSPGAGFDQAAYDFFVQTSYELYQQLIQPAIDQLDDHLADWVIIPDYYLNYIPFDILLRSKSASPKGSLSPRTMDYLFEDFNISYDYSITLHLKNQNRVSKEFKYDFVGFAPSFKAQQTLSSRLCSEDELYALQCSEKEIESIANLTNGDSFSGAQANRQYFESKVQDYRIIHLATHACIDEENSSLNKIFLTDDYLSDFDLYNMQLNSELAVLSACNTGSGKLIKGEGVMSLARGFINAGCSSTLISMWSVDDCATSDIMLYFYEGLSEGLSKEKALKAAKIKYLDAASKLKMHPYYWAAFVPFGDMESIAFHQQSNLLFYIIPVTILAFLFFLFFRKK